MKLLCCFALLALAFDKKVVSEETTLTQAKTGSAVPGAVCNLEQSVLAANMDNQYFECVIPKEHAETWAWPQLGLWHLQNCSDGTLFSSMSLACKNETTVRRQQACGWGGCDGQQIVVKPQTVPFVPQPQTWFQSQPWYQQTGCGPQGCQPHNAPVPAPPLYPVQPVQPQVIIEPQPQLWSPCGPRGCPQTAQSLAVQPVAPVQPVSSCGPQGCAQVVAPPPALTNCGPPPAPTLCPTPCGRPQCPRPVVKRPCPQASGCGGSQSCGQYCSWMMDPLRPGPAKGYMQCVPVANPISEYCGRWVPRRCGHGSMFNARAQVCIRDPSVRPRPQPQCPQRQIAIGPCNQQKQCPGFSICQRPTNTCCQQAQWQG